ncbi:MAG: guanylate kinase [Anaerolineaceae bacterium]|nr:guanylate kinase [Anaerolineaceae bacterium]
MVKEKVDFNILEQMPLMVVISGPSGVGKDSVLRALKKSNLPIYHVVTANTRAPRPDEKEGVDYFFVSREAFEKMISADELIEYSRVYDDYKGVPKAQIRKAIASDKDVILRLDVQGAEKIKKLYPDAVLIFLTPANEEEWYQRLGGRRLSQEKDFETRITTVKDELKKAHNFDYIVVNAQNQLQKTISIIEAIITAEHQKSKPRKISI